MAEKECHGIRRVDKYVDPEGREVSVFVQVFGKDKDDGESLVKGAVMLRMAGVAPNGMQMPAQNIRLEWAFPEGTSIKKAFELFDAAAQAEVDKFKKDMDERSKAGRIVRAGSASLPPLLGANGKAMQIGG